MMNHDEKNGFLRENFTFIMSGVIFLMSKPEFRVSKNKKNYVAFGPICLYKIQTEIGTYLMKIENTAP
jgi:hypothetical protein